MVKLKKIVNFLDKTLNIKAIPDDHSNNGLQVAGDKDVKKAVFGVDISLELVKKSIELGSTFIFVHHGMSWDNSLRYITGNNYDRLNPMIKSGISLYASHLPLDSHLELGHNTAIADMLELENRKTFFKYDGVDVGIIGTLKKGTNLHSLNEILSSKLRKFVKENSHPYLYEVQNNSYVLDNSVSGEVKKIAVVSGGGGLDGVYNAISENVDCLITGEFTHSSYFVTKESNLSIIAPGHYLTETPGVIKVMKLLKKEFPHLEVEFIDLPTNL